ncbi:hypothetical protein [Kangiella shandongensis]|uniref:hypothetical protein n=1 Tax=Kangiella shandongensis TaxID=2763258 RepID=UPI001CC07E7F|nr:hypothetical protein [Kangiella shandongensis]
MVRKIFIALSVIFAVLLLLLIPLSSPTDLGPRVIEFALPVGICSAGFAIAAAIMKKG